MGVPLHHDLTGRTGVGTVVPRQAGLVRAHRPAGILRIGGDGNQADIGGKLALSTLLLQGVVLGANFVVVDMVVAVASGINARNEGDEGSCPGRSHVKLHCVEELNGILGFLSARILTSDWMKRMKGSNE